MAREKLQAVLKGDSADTVEDTGETAPAGSMQTNDDEEEITDEENDLNVDPYAPDPDADAYTPYRSDDLMEPEDVYGDSSYEQPVNDNVEEDNMADYYNPNWAMEDE